MNPFANLTIYEKQCLAYENIEGTLVTNSSKKFQGGGNTKSPPSKQISPSKRWCFTLNNYTEQEISSIVLICESECKFGLIGKEVGESLTPHLQGYLEFITKVRPKGLFTSRIHWEKCRGNRVDNVTYCSKEDNLIWSKGLPRKVKIIPDEQLFNWEKEIIDIIKEEPNDRSIYWYWGKGNVGKTSFCKYLTMKYGAICVGGKGADIRNAIVEYTKTNGDTPSLILINLPKSFNCDYISYEGVENVKDMYFYSGKYEGGMICGNNPHLIIFANEPPDESKLSPDRWIISKI